MRFYNINNPTQLADLRSAVLSSTGENGALFMPIDIPLMPESFYKDLRRLTFKEIAYRITEKMLGEDLLQSVIDKLVSDAFNFDIPLRELNDNVYVLELFHGPTLAFKDVGARFMAALFEHLLEKEDSKTTILVATSGDTGSAVASAFSGKQGIDVIILFPSGRVSKIQEKMLCTIGGNITAIEINGDFDDCQDLVKQAFSDPYLKQNLRLTSANSINFARLFPQSFYYFGALAQLGQVKSKISVSVPSGNFGNLSAGILAFKMGLNIDSFVASTNSNSSVVDYLETGIYRKRKSVHTITNAMDVGAPNNFPRLIKFFNDSHELVSSKIKGFWFSDEQTREAMKDLYLNYGYISDPHGAVAWSGLRNHLDVYGGSGIFLETAHPAKFDSVVSETLKIKVNLPESFTHLLNAGNKALKMENDFNMFRDFLLNRR